MSEVPRVVENLPGLGRAQRSALRCLLRNGPYPGDWTLSTNKYTIEVLRSLMRRGYVNCEATESGGFRYVACEDLVRAFAQEREERATEHERRVAEVDARRVRTCEEWRRIRMYLEKHRDGITELLENDVRDFVLDHGVEAEKALTTAINELNRLISRAPR